MTSSSSTFPDLSQGFTPVGEIFAYLNVFNPAIEVVTFRLRGWCMLGVFLLPAFTRLGHEHSGFFESVRWNACVHRLDLALYSHPKEGFFVCLFVWFFFGGGGGGGGGTGSEPMLTPSEKNPLYRRLRGGPYPRCCITHDSEPNTLPTKLFLPLRG